MKLFLAHALLAVTAKHFLANAQIAVECETVMTYKYSSGNTGHAFTTVQHAGAPWIQLDLSNTNLAPTAQLVLTGRSSNMTLTAATLANNNGWSAVFTGDTVQVELVSSTSSSVAITAIKAGVCDTQPPASICGNTDDRIPSQDVRVGRWSNGGGTCTAWLISENVFLTAGHCGNPNSDSRLHFVYSTDTFNAPAVDQYAADVSSYQSSIDFDYDTGFGHDFGIGRLLPNSVTNLLPGVAQSAKCSGEGCGWYSLGPVPASTSGVTVRVTGHGSASVATFTQKTHTGALTAITNPNPNSYLLGYTMDTTGGNSGSPVINENTGDVIGIHTNGGCGTSGGQNWGTRIDHPDLQALITLYLDSTSPPTPAPSPVPRPPCSTNTWIDVTITTDNYPTETSYILKDTCSDTTIDSVPPGNFTAAQTSYTYPYCVSGGRAFDLTISDEYGDGICCSYGTGSYAVTYEGETETGDPFETSTASIQIGSCGVTPNPTTADPTPLPTPNPTSPTTCVDITVTINTDEHPDQTSWTLANVCTGQTVVAGPKLRSPNTLSSNTFCLPPARYNFVITDSVGDGLTGSGFYEVTLGGGAVATGSEFVNDESTAFGQC